MQPTLTLRKDNQAKSVPVGFSFTSFFFGMFVPLFRGDFAMFFAVLAVTIVSVFVPFVVVVLWLLPPLYNRYYASRLIRDGWTHDDNESSRVESLGLRETALFPLKGNELQTILIEICLFVGLVVLFTMMMFAVMGA